MKKIAIIWTVMVMFIFSALRTGLGEGMHPEDFFNKSDRGSMANLRYLISQSDDGKAKPSEEGKKDIPDEETVEDESGDNDNSSESGEGEEETDGSITEEGGALFSLQGLAVLSHMINTFSDQEHSEAHKKVEVRNRLKLKYGTENTYLFAVPNVYFITTFIDETIGQDYLYSEKPVVQRNLRLSTRASELSFNEMYLNYSASKFRLRLGNQKFAWGTGDVINPTSYFNPNDVRELIFKEDDELTQGIPAASGMLYFNPYVLELVFAPIHVPMAIPENGNFWFPRFSGLPIRALVLERDGLEPEGKNFAYGARLSRSVRGVDLSISGYHGPDKEAVFVPSGMVIAPGELIAVEVRPEYYLINKIGLDASSNFDKFVVQCEMAYSPDKHGLEKLPDTLDLESVSLPLEVRKSHFFSYSTGFNYFIPLNRLFEGHDGDTVFTFEWAQSFFFRSYMEEPFLNRVLTARIEDTYFDGRLLIKCTVIYEAKEWGRIVWPKIEYDFQNGFSIEISYAGISGSEDSFFNYYQDHDIFLWKIRYTY